MNGEDRTGVAIQVDRMGVEPITPTLQGSVAPNGMPAHLVFFERSVRELNPAFFLTTEACGRNTYRPCCASDPGWNRTSTFLDVGQASSPLDHGIMSVTRVGVEPTKSPRPQRDRFAGLRTWPFCK